MPANNPSNWGKGGGSGGSSTIPLPRPAAPAPPNPVRPAPARPRISPKVKKAGKIALKYGKSADELQNLIIKKRSSRKPNNQTTKIKFGQHKGKRVPKGTG